MKITKTASGKTSIKLSKTDWVAIGKTAGWWDKLTGKKTIPAAPAEPPKPEDPRKQVLVDKIANFVFRLMTAEEIEKASRWKGWRPGGFVFAYPPLVNVMTRILGREKFHRLNNEPDIADAVMSKIESMLPDYVPPVKPPAPAEPLKKDPLDEMSEWDLDDKFRLTPEK